MARVIFLERGPASIFPTKHLAFRVGSPPCPARHDVALLMHSLPFCRATQVTPQPWNVTHPLPFGWTFIWWLSTPRLPFAHLPSCPPAAPRELCPWRWEEGRARLFPGDLVSWLRSSRSAQQSRLPQIPRQHQEWRQLPGLQKIPSPLWPAVAGGEQLPYLCVTSPLALPAGGAAASWPLSSSAIPLQTSGPPSLPCRGAAIRGF